MSDKPKPGKDKDLRYLRQAMEATDLLFCLLGELTEEMATQGDALAMAEAFLLVAEQLDQLSEMVDDPAVPPREVIEQNRQVRAAVRQLMQVGEGAVVAQLAQAAGNQLRALLVVKEIRAQNGQSRPFVSVSTLPTDLPTVSSLSTVSGLRSRKQRDDVFDQ
jgi:hypothetical protein